MKKMKQAFPPGGLRFYILSLFSFLISVGLHAQTVTGTVRDEESKPIFGATVTVKGTNRTTVTNSTGNFSITAGGSDVLVISYVGFVTLDIPLDNRKSLSVSMAHGEGTNLNEVVVTALGIRRQERSLGYSATSVNTDELIKNRTTNVGESLEGKSRRFEYNTSGCRCRRQ